MHTEFRGVVSSLVLLFSLNCVSIVTSACVSVLGGEDSAEHSTALVI